MASTVLRVAVEMPWKCRGKQKRPGSLQAVAVVFSEFFPAKGIVDKRTQSSVRVSSMNYVFTELSGISLARNPHAHLNNVGMRVSGTTAISADAEGNRSNSGTPCESINTGAPATSHSLADHTRPSRFVRFESQARAGKRTRK